MLRQQKGFLGCVMSRDADEGLVLTFWPDIDAVAALDESQSYQATVARILEADLMAGTQSTEIKEIHLIEIPGMA
jgi:heme-degrading monooxygenase HmoA